LPSLFSLLFFWFLKACILWWWGGGGEGYKPVDLGRLIADGTGICTAEVLDISHKFSDLFLSIVLISQVQPKGISVCNTALDVVIIAITQSVINHPLDCCEKLHRSLNGFWSFKACPRTVLLSSKQGTFYNAPAPCPEYGARAMLL
jgi:hypothetical protein